MTDEQFFLANAYVDGELTDDERRTADADPAVMAEVERLRALQAEVRAVPAPPAEAREAAIGAAMAEFHAARVTSPAAEPSVVPLRPRPAYAKYLAVAAALVAVAGLGIVVSQVRGGDDDAGFEDTAIAESSAREEVLSTLVAGAATADPQTVEPESAQAGAAADIMEETAESSGESIAAEAAEDGEDGEDGDDAMGAEPAFGADATAERVGVPTDFDPDAPILNEVGLAIYGSYLLDQRDVGVLGPTPETRCAGNYDVLDRAIYVLDGDDRDVYIAVNEFEGFVLALEVEDCIELAKGDLF